MLAVQGAVEAARAGEEGKGFAVVAADIQNLADNSGQNAEKIKDLVLEIEKQIQISIQDTRETASINTKSSDESKIANGKLEQVDKEFKKVTDEIYKVQSNTEDSKNKISVVNDDMSEIVKRAEDIFTQINVAKDEATKGNRKMRELSDVVSTIVSLADEMQK